MKTFNRLFFGFYDVDLVPTKGSIKTKDPTSYYNGLEKLNLDHLLYD